MIGRHRTLLVALGVCGATMLLTASGRSEEPQALAPGETHYAIPAGQEERIRRAMAPLEIGDEAGAGFVIHGIRIDRNVIAYTVRAIGRKGVAAAMVYHPDDERAPDLPTIHGDRHLRILLTHDAALSSDEARAALQPLVARLAANSRTLDGLWDKRTLEKITEVPLDARRHPTDPVVGGDILLITAGLLLLAFILASGRPAFLR